MPWITIKYNRILCLLLISLSLPGAGQVHEADRIGQTPGGAGYHVNYDSASRRLFVGCGTSIWVYDTQDTADIHVVARRPLLGLVNETDLWGTTLFVAATHDGVWALDATSDTLTVLAHHIMTGDSAAYDLCRTNDTLYVADGKKVRMLRYDTITHTFTRLATFGPSNAFCVARKGVHVAIGAQGIPKGTVMIYRYDNPEIPVAMWQSSNAWNLQAIRWADLRDDILYVCGGAQNLLFTQSYFFALHHDTSFLAAVDSFSVPGIIGLAQANINNLDSQKDTLFISTGAGLNNQLQPVVPVYDATGLPDSNLVHLTDILPGLWHFDVARMHGTPYLAMSSEWLGVLISDVSQLQPDDTLGFLETGGWCQRSYIRGDTLWACMRGYGLVAYETDSLLYHSGYMNEPAILHVFTQFVSDVAFLHDTLILLSTGEFFNLKPWMNGGLPVPAGNLGFGCETIRSIETNLGTRVIAGHSNLLLPLRQLALYNPNDSLQGYPVLDIDSTNSNVNGLLVVGDTLFCGKKTGNTFYLAMFRVQNDSLILLDMAEAPAEITGISRDGNTVAVSCGMFRFAWYYIDGTYLVPIGEYFDWNINCQDLRVKNDLIYVADKFFGLKIYQLSEPPEATLVAECRGTGGWINLFGSMAVNLGPEGRIYLSDFNAGVIIIEPYDSTLVTVTPHISCHTEKEQIISLFPNPSTFCIHLVVHHDGPLIQTEIQVYDISGTRVIRRLVPEVRPGEPVTLKTDGLSPGVYLIRVTSQGNNIGSGKFVITL